MARGRPWDRSELLPALSLYYQIPFGSIDARNPAIRALASDLGRTVGSVALKLANFASLDPTIIESGRKGMQNASQLDRAVFEEFYERWDELAFVMPDKVQDQLDEDRLDVGDPNLFEIGDFPTEILATVAQRRGQRFFRNAVLSAYGNTCCLTGISEPKLLRAGHIIPWSVALDRRLDPRNGLCLNALHDAAFDRGLMTLDDDLRAVFSNDLKAKVPEDCYRDFFAPYSGRLIRQPARLSPLADALEYHRNNVFC